MKNLMSCGFGVLSTGAVGVAAYTLMNKKTKNNADKLINNVLDKVNNSNVMK